MALLQQAEECSPLSPDENSDIGLEKSHGFPNRPRQLSPWKFLLYFCTGVCLLALGMIIGVRVKSYDVIQSNPTPSVKSALACGNPSTRREWRSLSTTEKHNYLEAVECLRETPSRLGLNQSLYDDFPWVHSRIGEYCELHIMFCVKAAWTDDFKLITLLHFLSGTGISYILTSEHYESNAIIKVTSRACSYENPSFSTNHNCSNGIGS